MANKLNLGYGAPSFVGEDHSIPIVTHLSVLESSAWFNPVDFLLLPEPHHT